MHSPSSSSSNSLGGGRVVKAATGHPPGFAWALPGALPQPQQLGVQQPGQKPRVQLFRRKHTAGMAAAWCQPAARQQQSASPPVEDTPLRSPPHPRHPGASSSPTSTPTTTEGATPQLHAAHSQAQLRSGRERARCHGQPPIRWHLHLHQQPRIHFSSVTGRTPAGRQAARD